MYLIGGATKKTCAATLGTLAGVVLAGISAWCFSKASGISGYNVSDIETLMTLWNTNRIQVGGLLFSGLLISCLGAVMDVAISISSAIDEIYKQNSSLTKKELFKAGMRVGSFGIVLSVSCFHTCPGNVWSDDKLFTVFASRNTIFMLIPHCCSSSAFTRVIFPLSRHSTNLRTSSGSNCLPASWSSFSRATFTGKAFL